MAYICYLTDPDQHTNAAASWPGYGETKAEAERNARYWANQLPWVRTVPASRAPRWATVRAKDSAVRAAEAAEQERPLTPEEAATLAEYRDGLIHFA